MGVWVVVGGGGKGGDWGQVSSIKGCSNFWLWGWKSIFCWVCQQGSSFFSHASWSYVEVSRSKCSCSFFCWGFFAQWTASHDRSLGTAARFGVLSRRRYLGSLKALQTLHAKDFKKHST